MHGHESELLTTTFLMLSAVSFGLILRRLKQPPLVGYILAGLALGPAGLGLVDYSDEISSLAEFGVILLLFIIGIELSVKAFLLVRIVIALLVLAGLLVWIGKTARQRLPLAILLEGNVALAIILFSLGACMLTASLTGTMGLSAVFGAFCAGLALSHTNLRKAVLDAILPLQSLLLVVFFVSIGLLVDLDYVKSHWGVIAAVTLGVLFIKTLFGWRFYHWAANQLVARWYHHW